MRVAISALSVKPNLTGGGETVLVNLVRALPSTDPGIDYLLFVTQANRHLFAQDGVKLVTAPRWVFAPILRVFYEILVLPLVLRRWRADCFLAVNQVASPLVSCPTLAVVQNLLYYRFRELYGDAPLGPLARLGLEVRNIYFSLLNGFSVRRAAHVIAVSETVRDEIVAKDGIAAEKISVVPLALSEFLPPPKQAHLTDIGVPEPFFLYVGAWEPYKNIDKILAGLARLRIKYGSDARLVILGLNVHGYGEALADHARALGVYEAVHFVGPTPHAELTTWYCKATALVLLSACEAFPLTPFEAMINDLPVIGAHDGAVAEIIEDGGLLVDPADAAAVAAAMHRALTDCELAEQLAEQGRRRAGQYSWARTASEITALLRTYQQSP